MCFIICGWKEQNASHTFEDKMPQKKKDSKVEKKKRRAYGDTVKAG